MEMQGWQTDRITLEKGSHLETLVKIILFQVQYPVSLNQVLCIAQGSESLIKRHSEVDD